jgi:hypothetical protein
VILSLVVLVAVFLAAPSAMAKKALTEDELEMISAAGEPMIVSGTTITYTDNNQVALTLDAVQAGLNALTLNNVAGENQLATGLNILSSATDNAAGLVGQANTITQSWGGTYDFTVVATAGGAGGAACGAANTTGITVCINSPGGKGGDAKSTRISAYGDVGIDADSTADVNLIPNYVLTLANGSQDALVALVVNNVVGMNQVASAINIASGAISFNPLLVDANAGTNRGMDQVNTINQYRGSPFGFATR